MGGSSIAPPISVPSIYQEESGGVELSFVRKVSSKVPWRIRILLSESWNNWN